MKIKSGQSMRRAVEKIVGKKQFTSDLLFDTLKMHNIQWIIIRSKAKILKYEAAIAVINNDWDIKTALGLPVKAPPQTPPDPNDPIATTMSMFNAPPEPDACICLIVPNMTFEAFVKLVSQTIKMKAFL